jgi:hypothetical protein
MLEILGTDVRNTEWRYAYGKCTARAMFNKMSNKMVFILS